MSVRHVLVRAVQDRRVRLAARWQQAWRASLTRRYALWYRDQWMEHPMPHSGVILLTAIVVYWWGRPGQSRALEDWWGAALGLGILGLFNRESWASLRHSSRVLRWWDRRRTGEGSRGDAPKAGAARQPDFECVA